MPSVAQDQDNVTPLKIAQVHRPIYRYIYMMETLKDFNRAKRLNAFDGNGHGFPNCYIVVAPYGPSHVSIWASNYVRINEDGSKEGVIQINNDIRKLSKIQQKIILAEEWIELMLTFHHKGVRNERRVFGKEEAVCLFNTLKRRSLWQDSSDFTFKMTEALRWLMVSRDSIDEMLDQEFEGMTVSSVRQMIKHDPTKAEQLIPKFVNRFGDKWSVDTELVYERFQEILFSGA